MFSIIYYIVILVAVSIFLILSLLAWFFVPLDPARKLVHAASRGISMVFFRTPPMWKTIVEGLENIDRNEKYVIVLNHRSFVDIPMLYWTPLNFRWVSKKYIQRFPFIGQYMWLHGDILIPEKNPRKAADMILRKGRMWLDRGVSVAIFPEGTRSKEGQIGRFKITAFNLAREGGVRILPVVLSGSDVIGRGGRLPWRHTFHVKVLKPVAVVNDDPKVTMEQVQKQMTDERSKIH